MQTFRKVLSSILLVVIMVGGISLIVVNPYLHSNMDYDQDSEVLDDMAGTIDCLIVGASHAKCSYVPETLDAEVGCVSYNLSTALMPMGARYVILEKELSRNPVRTVVMEISYNSLERNAAEEYGDGEAIMFARLRTWEERLSYLVRYVKPNQWLDVYSRTMNSGLTAWKDMLFTGGMSDNVNRENRGFYPREAVDISMDQNTFNEIYHTKSCMNGFETDNVKMLEKIIALCHEYDTEIIIAISPCADLYIYRYTDLDEFDAWLRTFAEDNGCSFYNFNLIKNRFEVFSSKDSFLDETHMSEHGARQFTRIFADVYRKAREGYDTSLLFYDDYEELTKNSPYLP